MTDEQIEQIDEIAVMFADAIRAGERPQIQDYVQRYPALAQQINDLFPTIESMERLKKESTKDVSTKVTQIGDYVVGKLIGSGGMGQVFEAHQAKLERRIALKILPKTEAVALARFDREMKLVASLDHPHIIPIYDAGEADGLHYFAMRLIEGVSIAQLIEQWIQYGPPAKSKTDKDFLPDSIAGGYTEPGVRNEWTKAKLAKRYRSAAIIIAQAAQGLQYAHDHGVLHRDIKPGNLLVDKDGRCYLVDFGIAKGESFDTITVSGAVPGTIRYMAPEQFSGESDHRADIYALGITLLELASLRSAFQLSGGRTNVQKIITKGLPSPRSIDNHMPAELANIITHACAKDPRKRYRKASELEADLYSYLQGEAVAYAGARQKQRLLILVGACIAALLLFLFWPASAIVDDAPVEAQPSENVLSAAEPETAAEPQKPQEPQETAITPAAQHPPQETRQQPPEHPHHFPEPPEGAPRHPPGLRPPPNHLPPKKGERDRPPPRR